MKRMMGLVCANYDGERFGLLCDERPAASLPFGGRYRLIDFPLSNMINSGINTVGLITPFMYRSLMDHVGNGKAWSLSRKVGGMFILAGSAYGMKTAHGKFQLRDVTHNKAFLERSHRDVVVVASAAMVYNIDFREVLKQHEESGAVITLLYRHAPEQTDVKALNVVCDARGRVTGLEKKDFGELNQFIDCFLIDRELLLKFTDWYSNMGYLDLTEVIEENLDKLAVYGYEFKGYACAVESKRDYMAASMDLLKPEVMQELFMGERKVKTKVQDAPPVKYFPGANVRNSMIATGCIIKGTVENSIIFRGCTVEEGAVVRNSVVMANGTVRSGAELDQVICDKYVDIEHGVHIAGTVENPHIVTRRQHG